MNTCQKHISTGVADRRLWKPSDVFFKLSQFLQIEGGDGGYSRIAPNLTKQKQGRVRGDLSHTENPGCIGGSV